MGTIDMMGTEVPVSLVDASCGGFKLLTGRNDALGGSLGALPREFRVRASSSDAEGAILWSTGGMLGCQFFEYVPLETVADLMAGGFRVCLQPHG